MDYAAALTRLGFTRRARDKLKDYVNDPALGRTLSVDLLLQLGNIVLEEAQHAATKTEQRHTAEEALAFYQQALKREPARLEARVLTAAVSSIQMKPKHRPAFLQPTPPASNGAPRPASATTRRPQVELPA